MTQTSVKHGTCLDCGAAFQESDRYVYCEPCRAQHVAAWKEQHTRKVGDTRKGWLIGDECRVVLRGIAYDAKIIDMSDVSRHESDYDLVKLELTKSLPGFDGKTITQTWIHPEPVQSYKLKKRLLED